MSNSPRAFLPWAMTLLSMQKRLLLLSLVKVKSMKNYLSLSWKKSKYLDKQLWTKSFRTIWTIYRISLLANAQTVNWLQITKQYVSFVQNLLHVSNVKMSSWWLMLRRCTKVHALSSKLQQERWSISSATVSGSSSRFMKIIWDAFIAHRIQGSIITSIWRN